MQHVKIHSYEMGGQNWTEGFRQIFEERKDYDFTPSLPLVADRFMAGAQDAVNDFDVGGSAAHIYGKPVISAEPFTSRPEINWRGNPAMAKVDGDKAWALGILLRKGHSGNNT